MALLLPVVSSCADSASSDLFTLSLHCALPICGPGLVGRWFIGPRFIGAGVASGTGDGRPPRRRDGSAPAGRSEEHTSELQSRGHIVCRLLLEKRNEFTQYHDN